MDGLTDHVHDARVATRRIRELLPLISDRRRVLDDLQQRFKRIGRALGRVRDSDVLIDFIKSLETRIPHAAPTLVMNRQAHERNRLELTRELIKTLEKLDAERLLSSLSTETRSAHVFSRRLASSPAWQALVQRTLMRRAEESEAAIITATGVYFPKRTHAARIAIKKFRYVLEIAHGTAEREAHDAIHALKHAQGVLGEIHDRQVFIDELSNALEALEPERREPLTLVTQVVEAEIHSLHQKYLGLRTSLLEISREHARRAQPGTQRATRLLAGGALAFSALLVAQRRRILPAAERVASLRERVG
jgi:CHAD domain-containing protein